MDTLVEKSELRSRIDSEDHKLQRIKKRVGALAVNEFRRISCTRSCNIWPSMDNRIHGASLVGVANRWSERFVLRPLDAIAKFECVVRLR